MSRIGPYEIVEEIGRGGMGIVFRAVDPVIGRSVAVKTIRLDGLVDPKEKARLRDRLFREARSAALLSHPNIVTIYQIAEQADLAYIAMEFVRGPNLDQVLSRGRPLEREALLEAVRQIAAALDYAHSKGIVHRDIKPANILFSETGEVKISDFGIAKLSQAKRLTRTGLVIGTPPYMSPEQVQDKPVDGRADQFSLAVMAFAMLTGVEPFDSELLTAIYFKIVYEEPPPVMGLNPTLSAEIQATLYKGLAKDPAARFRTCTEFWKSLAGACERAKGWRPMTLRSRVATDVAAYQVAEAPLSSVVYGTVQHCPECQAVLPAGLLYCGYCGVSLKEAAARAEEKRAEEERKRIAAEKLAEETRRTEEERRRIAEEQRRVAVERQKAEEQRKKIEAERREAEAKRLAAEEQRRKEDEVKRRLAEQQRQEEEAKRRIAEQQRKAAEEKQRREEEEKRAAEARQRADEEERKARDALAAKGRRSRLESLRAEGAVAFDRGEYGRAIGLWEEALELAPEDGELQRWIAESKARRLKAAAEASEQEDQRGEEEAAHRRPAEQQPRSREEKERDEGEGKRAAEARQRSEEEKRDAREARAAAARRARAEGLRADAWALFRLGNYAEACAQWEKALQLSPEDSELPGLIAESRLRWQKAGAEARENEASQSEKKKGTAERTDALAEPAGDGQPFADQPGTIGQNGSPRKPRIVALAVLGSALLLLSGLWIFNHGRPKIEPKSPLPRIAWFMATPDSIHAGGQVRLDWYVHWANRLTIDPEVGQVAANGSFTVAPPQTTTYELKAFGDGGTASAKTTVSVNPIALELGTGATLSATPPRVVREGSPVVLSWNVPGATAISIDQGIGIVPPSGRRRVHPKETTTYTLTAHSPAGDVTRMATVEAGTSARAVAEPPVIKFWAETYTIERGQSATLLWMIRNATDASIDQGIGTVPLCCGRMVFPGESTTYILTAQGPGGTSTAVVTVNVQPARGGGDVRPLQAGRVGLPFHNALVARGEVTKGNQAWSVSSGNLPYGLGLNVATGEISGTPSLAGDFAFTIAVTNGGTSGTAAFSIHIDPAQ